MRIIVIGCHPDDLWIGCGGTLAGVGFLPEEYTDITTTPETKLRALEMTTKRLLP